MWQHHHSTFHRAATVTRAVFSGLRVGILVHIKPVPKLCVSFNRRLIVTHGVDISTMFGRPNFANAVAINTGWSAS